MNSIQSTQIFVIDFNGGGNKKLYSIFHFPFWKKLIDLAHKDMKIDAKLENGCHTESLQ